MSTSDNLPARNRKLSDLLPEERASIAQDVFIAVAKGQTKKSQQEIHRLSAKAINTLIAEYGAYMAETRQHSKEAGIVVYDYVISKGIENLDNPTGVPAIVWAKSFEAIIQGQTRKDKLLGHEAPTHNINTKGETLTDLWQRMYGHGGDNEGVSPVDSGYIGEEEEIEEAEVIDDSTDNAEEEGRPS